jgi:Domain of Unknown Function (DUF1259)
MTRLTRSRERLVLLALVAFAFVVAIAAASPSAAGKHPPAAGKHRGWEPVATTAADWSGVASALGRPGTLMSDNTVYRVSFPRRDLTVTSYGVTIKPGFALGSYAAFARYRDGQTLLMGDLVVTETELQAVTDALHAHGLEQTAVHKHLLAHEPDLWWTHIHGVSADPVALASALRAALDQTGTPPPAPPAPPPALDLNTAGIDNALGATGTNDGGIYKFTFARDETITMDQHVLNPAMGVTTALNFQPTGGGRAAINGDFVMTADEVQDVIEALRAGGIQIVELHNHSLDDEPRLFYMHFWANDDAVKLAQTLRHALDATAVHPAT